MRLGFTVCQFRVRGILGLHTKPSLYVSSATTVAHRGILQYSTYFEQNTPGTGQWWTSRMTCVYDSKHRISVSCHSSRLMHDGWLTQTIAQQFVTWLTWWRRKCDWLIAQKFSLRFVRNISDDSDQKNGIHGTSLFEGHRNSAFNKNTKERETRE